MKKEIMQHFVASSLRNFRRGIFQFSFMGAAMEIVPMKTGWFAVCAPNVGAIINLHQDQTGAWKAVAA